MPVLYWIVSGVLFVVAAGFVAVQREKYSGNPLTSSYRDNLFTLLLVLGFVLFLVVPTLVRRLGE